MAQKQSFKQRFLEVQKELKAPKNQYNNFGKYKYRSHEDILEAVKPLLHEKGMYLVEIDEIIQVGDRCFVKSIATVHDVESEEHITVSGAAEIPVDRKGMDAAQVTGASSSYARKYTLNGLFCIDDTKDADATNDHTSTDRFKKGGDMVKAKEFINSQPTKAKKQEGYDKIVASNKYTDSQLIELKKLVK